MGGHPVPGPRPGTPRPGDHTVTRITPEQLGESLDAVLGEQASTLAQEADQLTRAHQILHDALQ
ncbi:hypothetical protein [Corynebacterium pygosceleis]|uniref:hypothetical protein n=1 Tax=Corynebacterium pygosceleis TaxID=2800406 RepID=UPI0019071B68|nr:hypothetical protein [Corynebacterium pygosceleis]MCK7674612.1 hypothetical protein [Corynebacterium pygosceleis]MCL0120086.1 hypothetical protein [Corynebacterium pygosceleis]